MDRVLIYGFGETGESMLNLCNAFGFETFILDEGFSPLIRDRRFIHLEEVRGLNFRIALICIVSPDIATEAKAKLQAHISEEKIRHVHTYEYRSSMSYLLNDYFHSAEALLQLWENDTPDLKEFHARLADVVSAHRRNKKEQNDDSWSFRQEVNKALEGKNIFAKLYETKRLGRRAALGMLHYPNFFVLYYSGAPKDDDGFFFVEPISWDALATRSSDTKLICLFGNSALRTEYLGKNSTISHFLRHFASESSKPLIIVNAAVSGHTIYEQMMLYNALFYPLKPEIVISYFGGTDIRMGYICDEILTKRHKMVYMADLYELSYKNIVQSTTPLYSEIGRTNFEACNPYLSDNDVTEAVLERLVQFKNTVEANRVGGGATFYAIIQPLLSCKHHWTKEESKMQDIAFQNLSTPAYQHSLIARAPAIIASWLKLAKERHIDYLLDANEATKDSKKGIFTNYWIHCNEQGNKMVAQWLWDILRKDFSNHIN